MTQPDYPDYVPAGVPIAMAKTLQSFTSLQTTDLTSPTYDCSRFNSIDIELFLPPGGGIKLIQMSVNWLINGGVVAVDEYSVLSGSASASAIGGGAFQLPCKGDQFYLQFFSDAAHCTFQFGILATTRVLAAANITSGVTQDPLMPGWGLSVPLAINAAVTLEVGPFTTGFWVNLSSAAAANMNVFAWVLHAGVWNKPLIAQLNVSATNTGAQAPIYVVGRAIEIFVHNGSGAASTVSYSIAKMD